MPGREHGKGVGETDILSQKALSVDVGHMGEKSGACADRVIETGLSIEGGCLPEPFARIRHVVE
jgi:hypothetical protein